MFVGILAERHVLCPLITALITIVLPDVGDAVVPTPTPPPVFLPRITDVFRRNQKLLWDKKHTTFL